MPSDVFEIFANFVITDTPDLTSRLAYQSEALAELECISPVIGHWIDEYSAEHLLSLLSMDTKTFARSFPRLAHLAARERKLLRTTIETHLDQCAHCSLGRSYDLELQAQIDRTCRQNRGFLLQLLDKSDADQAAEGEHPGPKMMPVTPPPLVLVERCETDRPLTILASLVEDFQES